MRRVSLGLLLALLLSARVHAQSLDAQVSDAAMDAAVVLGGIDASVLDASVADASARDASSADGGARDAGAALRDAGPIDLHLPAQDCRLAHGRDVSGAVLVALALLLRRRRA